MPEAIERQECPECGAVLGSRHSADCDETCPYVIDDEVVTVRYVRESEPVTITDEMVARAERTWMLWKAPEPGHEDNARLFMRAVLDAALNGGKDG